MANSQQQSKAEANTVGQAPKANTVDQGHPEAENDDLETMEPEGGESNDDLSSKSLEEQLAHWKKFSRDNEKMAKSNRSAAEELQKLKDAQKTEAEKAIENAEKAEKRAFEAEAKLLRREVALDHKLSKEDAELLDDLTDEDAIRRMAERLAKSSEAEDDKPEDRAVRRRKPRQTGPESNDDKARKVASKLFSNNG